MAGGADFLAEADATQQAARRRFVAGTGSLVDDLALLTRCALVRSSLHQVIHCRGPLSAAKRYKPLRDKEERAVALGSLALRLSGSARGEIVQAALSLAKGAKTTGEALCLLVPLLNGPQRLTTVRRALLAMKKQGDAESRPRRLELAAHLPGQDATELVIATLGEADHDGKEDEWPKLGRIAATLPAAVVAEIWSWSRQFGHAERHLIQGPLCAGLAPERRADAASEVLDAVLLEREEGAKPGKWWLPPSACWSAVALIPCLPKQALPHVDQVIEAADGMASTLTVALSARFVELGMTDRAETLVEALPTREDRERAWCQMLPRLPATERPELWRKLNDSIGDDSRVWRYLDEYIEGWLEAVGADACLEVVERAEQRLPNGLTTSWRPLVAIARSSPRHAHEIMARLLAQAHRVDVDEHEVLFRLLPLLSNIPAEAARRLVADLLVCLSGYPRPDFLNNWTGENLCALVPLLEHIAGEAGVYAVAKQVTEVGEWFP